MKVYTRTSLKEILFFEKEFTKEPEDKIREKAINDFATEKAELEILEGRLEDLLSVVKTQNPWLYLQIQTAFKDS